MIDNTVNPATAVNATSLLYSSGNDQIVYKQKAAGTIDGNVRKDQINNVLDNVITDAKKDDEKSMSADKVKKMTDDLNIKMQEMNVQLKFTWYKDLDRLAVKMIDSTTHKTIKSFPPEEIMKTLERTKEWVGRFLDENA